MKISSFSKKQLRVLTWWCKTSPDSAKDAVICDGAVRSGKTVCMGLSFVLWAFFSFSSQNFAICGKTVTSLRRNVITPLKSLLLDLGFEVSEFVSKNYMEVLQNGKTTRFYFFGGRDESSSALIQGVTLAGVMFDEVALMPRSFVEQALARCSVSGSKFWFNCNPEHPFHWFYTEWIQKTKEKNALYLHFTMQDNPSLSRQIVKRYQTLYTGAFYDRFVLGKWSLPTGLVYPQFSIHSHCFEQLPDNCKGTYYVSCDYGTVNPFSMGLWLKTDNAWYRLSEYYYDSRKHLKQKTDEEYYLELENLAQGYSIHSVIIDPSAASFIECVRRHGRFQAVNAKNDVNSGIRRVADALSGGKLKIHSSCKDSIREFSLYSWDTNARTDTPKKENDHAMDDIRYLLSTALTADTGFFVLSTARN